jgi:hypothetical protein
MEEKRGLYFATGAKEVWICERRGMMRFFDCSGEIARSCLVPEFPTEISVGIRSPVANRGPRLHDLRHSFLMKLCWRRVTSCAYTP